MKHSPQLDAPLRTLERAKSDLLAKALKGLLAVVEQDDEDSPPIIYDARREAAKRAARTAIASTEFSAICGAGQ